jgi:NAD(P)H-dependent FMN reductase
LKKENTVSLKIGIVIASTRPTRVGKKVADWFHGQIKETPDVQFEIIDLKEKTYPFE